MPTLNSKTVTTTRQLEQQNNGNISTSIEVNTTKYYRQFDIVDYIFAGVLVLIIIIGIVGFIKSIKSRKHYKCPVCGESFRSENMESQTCKVCGANLEETDDTNITDKTK